MSGFVRSSHYRHVFVDPPKVENTYKGFRLATTTGEQQYIKGNTQFFAVALQGGGGPFAVVPYADVGHCAKIKLQRAYLMDFFCARRDACVAMDHVISAVQNG